MKKLIKFSALSLFVFASVCFVLSSCGKQNGGANGGGSGGGNTQINLAGSEYKGDEDIIEFENNKRFAITSDSEYQFTGSYKVSGNDGYLLIEWQASHFTSGKYIGQRWPFKIEDGGRILRTTVDGEIYTRM